MESLPVLLIPLWMGTMTREHQLATLKGDYFDFKTPPQHTHSKSKKITYPVQLNLSLSYANITEDLSYYSSVKITSEFTLRT